MRTGGLLALEDVLANALGVVAVAVDELGEHQLEAVLGDEVVFFGDTNDVEGRGSAGEPPPVGVGLRLRDLGVLTGPAEQDVALLVVRLRRPVLKALGCCFVRSAVAECTCEP